MFSYTFFTSSPRHQGAKGPRVRVPAAPRPVTCPAPAGELWPTEDISPGPERNIWNSFAHMNKIYMSILGVDWCVLCDIYIYIYKYKHLYYNLLYANVTLCWSSQYFECDNVKFQRWIQERLVMTAAGSWTQLSVPHPPFFQAACILEVGVSPSCLTNNVSISRGET